MFMRGSGPPAQQLPAAKPGRPAGLPREATSRRIDFRRTATFLGPGIVVAIAYVDPGNLATNVSAGSQYGYRLLWVIVMANLMAMLVQYLSAKLGLATGRNLAEHCRDTYPRSVSIALWLQAELVVMMTDLAEVVGGAIALQLLFGLPLLTGATLTVAGMLIIMTASRHGRRHFEAVILALLSVVLVAFVLQTLWAGVDGARAAAGLVPSLAGQQSVLLAVGIIGATVMPHAIYLHSALTQQLVARHTAEERRTAARSTLVDVVVALGVAGGINVAILLGAVSLQGRTAGSLTEAYEAFAAGSGQLTATVFAIALLASGLAASCVGIYSGQVVVQGFIQRSVPIWLRRLVSLVPTFVVLGAGVDPTTALVLSQVALSFGIPFALYPLLRLTANRALMGDLVNARRTTVAAGAVATVIVGLNVYLLIGLASATMG